MQTFVSCSYKFVAKSSESVQNSQVCKIDILGYSDNKKKVACGTFLIILDDLLVPLKSMRTYDIVFSTL